MFRHIDVSRIGLLVITAPYLYTLKLLSDGGYTVRNIRLLRCLCIAVPCLLVSLAASAAMEAPTICFVHSLSMTGYLLTQGVVAAVWLVCALRILCGGDGNERKRSAFAPWSMHAAYIGWQQRHMQAVAWNDGGREA